MADQTVRIDVISNYRGTGFQRAERDLQRLGRAGRHAADEVTPGLVRLGNASAVAGTALLVGVGAAMAIGAKAAIDFESGFAGVRKTVDGSEEEFMRLARGIRDMALEIPIAVGELNRIAELGGQLGVPIGAIEEFTTVIAKLGVTTNLSVDEAATGIARFINIMGSGFDKVDNIGSALVELGNNFATTEAEILQFGTRLAGIGATLDLTEGDILGLAAAFTSLGEPVERGATAVQRTFIAMVQAVQQGGEELELFAEVLGVTQEEFVQLFADDPTEAFLQFEQGLNRVNEAGGNTTGILKELGLGSQRTVGLLLKGASGYQLLRTGVFEANEAMRINLALNEEASKRFGTTQSAITLLKNAFTDLRISTGESTLGGIQGVSRVLAEFLKVIEENLGIFEKLMPLIITLAGAKVLGFLGGKIFEVGRKAFGATPRIQAFGRAVTNVKLASMALGGVLSLAVIALGAVFAVMAVNRAKQRAFRDAIRDLADTMHGFAEGTKTATDVYEDFTVALGQESHILDRALELEEWREFLTELPEAITAKDLVDLATTDFDAFAEWVRLNEELLQVEVQRALLDPGDQGLGGIGGGDKALLDAEIRLDNLRFIVGEILGVERTLREEEKLLARERQLEGGIQDPSRAPFRGGEAFPAPPDAEFPGPSPEELEEGLDSILEGTAEFGDEFAEEWQETIDTFNFQLTQWDDAWDDYEQVAKLSTTDITKSLGNYVADAQRMSDATQFVFDNYGSFWFDFWANLSEDARAGMAATLAEVGPEEFRRQFDAFGLAWNRLGVIAMEDAFHLAPEGAKRAMEAWPAQFESIMADDKFTDAFAHGSEDWVGALVDNFGVFLGGQQPEVITAILDNLDGAIDSVNAQLESQGFGIDFSQITADMTGPEIAMLFHSMGFSWAESIALGFAAADLPAKMGGEARRGAGAANRGATDIFEATSPSKVFMRLGGDVAEGFKIGVARGMGGIMGDVPLFRDIATSQSAGPIKVDVSGIQPSVGPSINFNGDVASPEEVTDAVQKGMTLTGLMRAAEVAPGAS